MALSVRCREGERRASELSTLIAASRETRAAANVAIARSSVLCERSLEAHGHAVAARVASRVRSRYAVVSGTVEGRATVAVVHRDGTVTGDAALLRRVEVVVALGDTFGEGTTVASIGGDPLASTLSTARACDCVRSIDVFGSHRNAVSGPPVRGAGSEVMGLSPDELDPTEGSSGDSGLLDVETEREEGRTVLRVRGELELVSADELAEDLERCVRDDVDVTVDLSAVSFIDARGVSVLIAARLALAARGHSLVLSGATERVRRTLAMCQIPEEDVE